jgi:hypothetical protein
MEAIILRTSTLPRISSIGQFREHIILAALRHAGMAVR